MADYFFTDQDKIKIVGQLTDSNIANQILVLLYDNYPLQQVQVDANGYGTFIFGPLPEGTHTAQLSFAGEPGGLQNSLSELINLIIQKGFKLDYMFPDPANVLYYQVNTQQRIVCPPFIQNGSLFVGSVQYQLMRMDNLSYWHASAGTWQGSAVWNSGTMAGTGIYYFTFTPPVATTYFVLWNAAGSLFTERTFVASDPIALSSDLTNYYNTILGSINALVGTMWNIVMGTHHVQIGSKIDQAFLNIAGTGIYQVRVETVSGTSKVPGVTVGAIGPNGVYSALNITNNIGTALLYLQTNTYTFVSIQNGIIKDQVSKYISGPDYVTLNADLEGYQPGGSANLPLAKLFGTLFLPTGEPATGTISFRLYTPSKGDATYLCRIGTSYQVVPLIDISAEISSAGYFEVYLIPNNYLIPEDSEYQVTAIATIGKKRVQFLDQSIQFIGTAGLIYNLVDFLR